MLKQFSDNDVFTNQIETHPRFNWFIYGSEVILNGASAMSGAHSRINGVPTGFVSLGEENVDRQAGDLIYPFVAKSSQRHGFRSISSNSYNAYSYGDVMSSSYPLSASIMFEHFYSTGDDRKRLKAIRNALNFSAIKSKHFYYSSSLANKETQNMAMLQIPTILYGSGIKKGSVNLKFFVTGALQAHLNDYRKNGELVQIGPHGSNGSGSVAGVAMYKEGFILLTGSWALNSGWKEAYNGSTSDNPRWYYYGCNCGADNEKIAGRDIVTNNVSFTLDYEGTQMVSTMTMFAHAREGECNYSNNPTFVKFDDVPKTSASWGETQYLENDNVAICNTVKTNYDDVTGSFSKQTWISGINVWDENKNLIMVAKLAQPLLKKESRNLVVKMRVDI